MKYIGMRISKVVVKCIILFIILSIVGTGCGEESVTDSPLVFAIFPDDGSTNVPLDINITATFDHQMDGMTIEGGVNFTLEKIVSGNDPTQISSTVSYNSSTLTAICDPLDDLEPESAYRIILKRDIKGANNEYLAQEYTWTFTTLSATVSPSIVATRPLEGAVSVSLNSNVIVTFSEDIDENTLNNNTVKLSDSSGTDVLGVITYNASSRTLLFDPAANLDMESTYIFTLTTGVTDKSGAGLEREYTFSFITGASLPADDIAPTFSGAKAVLQSDIGSTFATLRWDPATDSITAQSGIVYLIYRTTFSGSEDYTTPDYTTAPGVTSYTVTGLTPNTDYFFVVLARDRSGNISQNIMERSVPTNL